MDKKKLMQEIWKETLQLENLPAVDVSFFELGGNSFLATKVCMMYEDKTGIEIEMSDFYEKETIENLVD